MKCEDDDRNSPLDIDISCKRAAKMCQAAEEAYKSLSNQNWKPVYIIGTEVPVPGGTVSGENELNITSPEDAKKTIDETREAFFDLGLNVAWKRVVGLVVQPGVEFGDSSVIRYEK